MEYFGLFFEFIFLFMGIYIYLFAIGKISPKDKASKERSEDFRRKNSKWLRPVSLALIAIMLVNIILHISQLLS